MPDGDATFILLRDKIIEQGIEGVKNDDTFHGKQHKRDGAIAGFQICSQLNSLKEFEARIAKRRTEEAGGRREGQQIEDYWYHRCATVQIEFCYEVLKIYVGGYPNYSARAACAASAAVVRLRQEGKL